MPDGPKKGAVHGGRAREDMNDRGLPPADRGDAEA